MIKQIGPDEYQEVCRWWTAQNFPPVPVQSLPSTGRMAGHADQGIFAGWLYLPQEGNIGWLEWLVANPDAKWDDKQTAFLELMECIERMAQAEGIDLLFTSADKSKTRFIQRLQSAGFVDGGDTVAHLIKVIKTR